MLPKGTICISNLDGAMLIKFWFQVSGFCIMAATPIPVPDQVLSTVMHEKTFNSTYNFQHLRRMTSAIFIDNEALLLLLIMPIILFRSCIKSNNVTYSDLKKDETKQLTKVAKRKDGEEN